MGDSPHRGQIAVMSESSYLGTSGGQTSQPPRRKLISLFVLEDDFSGALAYALDRALETPAAIRAIRIRPSRSLARVEPPIPVENLSGDINRTLAELTSDSYVAVVQSPGDGIDTMTSQALADLRRTTKCLLVEVDADGEIMQVSGPHGWLYSAVRRAAPADGENTEAVSSGRGQVGTDHASLVPPPGA